MLFVIKIIEERSPVILRWKWDKFKL
jgi:hypothetical protein